uniref:Uncharacterized protein n=1 Tax=Rhizophora mucronata TaxID=61149 RepID=A0A2P2JEP2_RHIMU
MNCYFLMFVYLLLHLQLWTCCFISPLQLKAAREAVPLCVQGSAIGAVSTAFVAWKYSKSLHGVGLSFLAGGVFGWTFGQEFANHWLQLYRMDTLAAQAKYLEWWQKKCEQRS